MIFPLMKIDRVAPLVLRGITLMPMAILAAQTATPTFQLVSIARADLWSQSPCSM